MQESDLSEYNLLAICAQTVVSEEVYWAISSNFQEKRIDSDSTHQCWCHFSLNILYGNVSLSLSGH